MQIGSFEELFSVQVFFIIFRETLETAIIISVLLSFIQQRTDNHNKNKDDTVEQAKNYEIRKKLSIQVWAGAISGLLICLAIGVAFTLSFYIIGKDIWSYTERLWEGIFSILSSLIITVMGVSLLRINKIMKVRWWIKLGDAYKERTDLSIDNNKSDEDIFMEPEALHHRISKRFKVFMSQNILSVLPFVTTLREGLEAVVFIGGVGISQNVSSIPLSIFSGLLFGSIIGYLMFKGGEKMSLQYFLITSTCFLYVISAGLMSRGVWFLELERFVQLCDGVDTSELGSGPGSYDIANSVWHVNCCNGLTDGWWMVLNALVGWTNSATYGSILSYCFYWAFVIIWLEFKLYEEREGVLPFIPVKWQLKRLRKKASILSRVVAQERHELPLPGNIIVHGETYTQLSRDNSIEEPADSESSTLLH